MNNNKTSRLSGVKRFFQDNVTVIFFIIVAALAFKVSGVKSTVFLNEIVSRFCRNAFLVLALIIPVTAGLGLNFSIVIGAMAGQMAIIHSVSWGLTGFPCFIVALLVSTPIAVLFGFLVGKVLNKTKGNEMITSMILGYFANGIYQFIYLYIFGALIPFPAEEMMNDSGIGIKSSLGFDGNFKYSISNLWSIKLNEFCRLLGIAGIVAVAVYVAYKLIKQKKSCEKPAVSFWIKWGILLLVSAFLIYLPNMNETVSFTLKFVSVPVFVVVFIILLCIFNMWIFKTKLGHDFRAVGQNQQVAMVSGINVDTTRIIALIFSTVFAAWGQLIRVQDIGTMNTYSEHEQIALLAVAAILVGGASVKKATNRQALIGVILFHAMFAVSPQVGSALFDDSQIGEYFRVFLAYGIIFVALAMNAIQSQKAAKREREER